MENASPNLSPDSPENIHQFFRNLLTQRDERIRQMADENNRLRAEIARSQPAAPAPDVQTAQLLADLRAENERLRSSFSMEKMGLQNQISDLTETVGKLKNQPPPSLPAVAPAKRGISRGTLISMLFLAGLAGFFIEKFVFQPSFPASATFEHYRDQRQFQFEYDINQGQFSKVEETLNTDLNNAKLGNIRPEIEFLRKVVRASGLVFSQNGGAAMKDGYVSINSKNAAAAAPIPESKSAGKQRSLTITEETLTVRNEATKASASLGKLKKGAVCTIIDRTLTRDKVRAAVEGKTYEIQDYWYKIETDELSGWVFGFYTSKSMNQKIELDASGKPVALSVSELPQAQPISTTVEN